MNIQAHKLHISYLCKVLYFARNLATAYVAKRYHELSDCGNYFGIKYAGNIEELTIALHLFHWQGLELS